MNQPRPAHPSSGRTRHRRRPKVVPTAFAALLAVGGCAGGVESTSAPSTVLSTPADPAGTTSAPLTPPSTTRASSVTSSTQPSVSTATKRPPATATPPPIPVQARRPAPRAAPKPAVPKPPSGTGEAGQVLTLVNAERAKAGCRPVRASTALQRAAQAHSGDMASRDYFSHTSTDGRSFADRIRAAGYPGGTVGENIAAGHSTAAAVMKSWMASAGHRANILSCSFTALGVGHAAGGSYGHYWTQDFGG